MAFNLKSKQDFIEHIEIWENEKIFYFIGNCNKSNRNSITSNDKKSFFIFTIKKLKFSSSQIGNIELKDILNEDLKEYDENSLNELKNSLARNKATQLKLIEEAKCIFGFVKFYLGYYVLLISEFSKVGKFGSYIINRVEKIKMMPLFVASRTNICLDMEDKYLTIFKYFDISKQTYFSLTYDLTKTLQRNFMEGVKSEISPNFNYFNLNKTSNNADIKNTDNDMNINKSEENNSNSLNLIEENITNNQIYVDLNTNNTNKLEEFSQDIKLDTPTISNKSVLNVNLNNNPESHKNSQSSQNSNITNSNRSNDNICNKLKHVTNCTFLWNHYHLKEFFEKMHHKFWIVYFTYGFFEQIECSIYGLRFLVTVLARRNRHYAGTRYLKRGISDDGNVANDVETEQILEEISTSCPEKPIISSYVHIRGSVPIQWHQEQMKIISLPSIVVNYSDIFFEKTKRHFYLLTKRYGTPIIVCNLTKKNKEESKQEDLLNESYLAAVEFINSNTELKEDEKIIYYHYDLKKERREIQFYRRFYEISYNLIEQTNMFAFIPYIRCNTTYKLELQSGVIRSNCVDCLDRTNVFQQVIGTAVMVNQLRAIGINATEPKNEEEEMYGILLDLYKKMGHELSTQYAGSLAHKQTIKDNRGFFTKILNKVPELFNVWKRYFNNSFNDKSKQDSINLFLGKYRIGKIDQHLYDLINDLVLHKKTNLPQLPNNWVCSAFKIYEKYNLLSDIYPLIEDYLNKNFNPNLFQVSIKSKEIKEVNGPSKFKDLSKIPSQTEKVLNFELLNYISISESRDNSSKSKNSFLVCLENFRNYRKKKYESYVTNPFEKDLMTSSIYNSSQDTNFTSDILHKSRIKNFYSFNYNIAYDSYNSTSNSKPNLNSNRLQKSQTLDIPSTEEIYDKSIKNTKQNKKPIYEKKTSKLKEKESFTFTACEKPKYELKFTSFEIDADELNAINEFADPDPKYLQKSEYEKLDYFVNMEINRENVQNIFDPEFNSEEDKQIIKEYCDSNKISNEYVEDCIMRFNNSQKKKEGKSSKLKDSDILIYDVEMKQFFKKINNAEEAKMTKAIKENVNSGVQISLMNEDESLVKVKVKRFPVNIYEDHVI